MVADGRRHDDARVGMGIRRVRWAEGITTRPEGLLRSAAMACDLDRRAVLSLLVGGGDALPGSGYAKAGADDHGRSSNCPS